MIRSAALVVTCAAVIACGGSPNVASSDPQRDTGSTLDGVNAVDAVSTDSATHLTDAEADSQGGDVWTRDQHSGADAEPEVQTPDATAAADGTPDDDAPQVDTAPQPPGEFGASCTQNNDCLSGWCVGSTTGALCTKTCLDDCPDGWSCVGITGDQDVTFLCVPADNRLCQGCQADSQCGAGVCLTMTDGRRCTAPCEDQGDCAPGYSCTQVNSEQVTGDSTMQCVPDGGGCDCTPTNAGVSQPCQIANAHGSCWGQRTCHGIDGWGECEAPVPSAEVCDGVDNNCNLVADEDLQAAEPCAISNSFGTCSGRKRCDGFEGWRCVAREPAAETCDFVDNDCDGQIDEAFIDEAGLYVDDDNCGVCGHSCAGQFPNATSGCEVIDGVARCVVRQCDDGFYLAGATTCLPLVDATCLPCTADANCVVPGNACTQLETGTFCTQDCSPGTLSGSAGECPAGFSCTERPGGRFQCLPDTGSCTCLDDSDRDATRPCIRDNDEGTCSGLQVCDPTSGWSECSALTPGQEVCNGLDDDCNGVTDEEVVAPGQECTRENAFGSCKGQWQCSGVEGWVCSAATPAAEACDLVDNDCDGDVDEDFIDESSGRYLDDSHCGVCNKRCDGAILFASQTACALEDGLAVCVATACEAGHTTPPETAQVCIPVSGASDCTPCSDDQQCSSLPAGRCESLDQGRYCTRECATVDDCQGGDFECIQGRCLPKSRSCTCRPGQLGNVRACVKGNEFGSCLGTETCDPGQTPGWSACSAATPTAEQCNGLDDNCDGRVDELLVHDPPSCDVTNAFGTCSARYVCMGGDGWSCPSMIPAEESCDFADNDCDAQIDETFRDASGAYVHDEHCGTCGVSCAGTIPNATVACAANGGNPRCEIVACAEGFYQAGPLTCLPISDATCLPCQSDDNCPTPGDRCVAMDGGSYCGRDCGADNLHGLPEGTCDAGYYCTQLPDGAQQCVPDSFACDCLEGDAGKLRSCAKTNEAGACIGAESCDPSTGWGGCTAPTPTSEVCNGLDDDCNGLFDDLAGRGDPCWEANGAGTCEGVRDCDGTSEALVCTAQIPAEETCNGVDDDCDNMVDEDFRSDGLYVDDDHCGVCGRSCDTIPNAAGRCDASLDSPVCVVDTCDAGYVPSGRFQCLPAGLGLCDPCVSAGSCAIDGAACVALDDGSFCANPCASDANCPAGYSCEGQGQGSFCVPDTRGCTCDGSDTSLTRGCSATFSPTTGPSYECVGSQQCTSTGWAGCEMPDERCNLLDDDCDGATDEGFVGSDGRYASDEHCGGCGNNCTLLTFGGSAGVCNTAVDPPVCSLRCGDNCHDVNANPNDGCECCDPTPDDRPDASGVDSNCDGIDGNIALSIFVAKNGDDANDGSRFSPKLTIAAGLAAAASDGKRDVLVASGVYNEAVTLRADINLYGGYSGDYSVRDTLAYETAILGPAPSASAPGAVNAIGLSGAGPDTTTVAGLSVFGYAAKAQGASSYGFYIRNTDESLRVSHNRVFAGSGGKGSRGSDGSDGGDGQLGAPGIDALDVQDVFGVIEHGCSAEHHSAGGIGGTASCGGTDTSGGDGGLRTCPSFDGTSTGTPIASEAGSSGANDGGAGGGAGRDVFHQAFQCLGYATFGELEGEDGGDGDAGGDGESGAGCSAGSGSVVDGVWRPAGGEDGATGSHGSGGGGGGSGAGAWVHQSCDSKGFNFDNIGASGGGGGSGGCGGTGGTRGTGGGGAFGIFVTFDSAPSSAPNLHDNTIHGGVGGDGGDGGNAGVGGAGGGGGLGGAPGGFFDPPDPTYPGFKGGKGGNGGRGGHAGGGGGGCGGAAFGIYVWNHGGLDLSDWPAANAFPDLGAGGTGGVGGFSLGNQGGSGISGPAGETNLSP